MPGRFLCKGRRTGLPPLRARQGTHWLRLGCLQLRPIAGQKRIAAVDLRRFGIGGKRIQQASHHGLK